MTVTEGRYRPVRWTSHYCIHVLKVQSRPTGETFQWRYLSKITIFPFPDTLYKTTLSINTLHLVLCDTVVFSLEQQGTRRP